MGLFGALFTLGKGKADQAAESIEDKNRVLFAEQALKDMDEQLRNSQQNFGKMKAQVMGIDRDIASKTTESDSWITKAKALKAQEKESLALDCVKKSMAIKTELEALTSQKTLVESHLKQQEANVTKLRGSIDTGKRQLQSMKAMEQVSKSTDSLLDVNQSGVNSALSKFEAHTRKAQLELDEKTSMLEVQNAGDLGLEVDAALGGDNKAADDMLASL